MKKVAETWSRLRRFYLALGLDDALIAEGDAMAALAESAAIDAPGEYNAALQAIAARLSTAMQNAIRRDGAAANTEALEAAKELAAFMSVGDAARLAEVDAVLGTDRGAKFLRFVEWGRAGINDEAQFRTLVLALPRIPSITRSVIDAGRAPYAETRAKMLAQSILTVVETYYRPLLELVWRLSRGAIGKRDPEKPSGQTGVLMNETRKLWDAAPNAVRADDFIYFPANVVRVGAGHPGTMVYDVASKELVITTVHNGVQRVNEAQLKERHGEVFWRSRTMHFAMLRAAGLERAVLTVPGRRECAAPVPATGDGHASGA